MPVCVFQPLGPSDYLEIAWHFDTVIIRNVPRLKVALKNQARRLIALIDILYDQKVIQIRSNAGQEASSGTFSLVWDRI